MDKTVNQFLSVCLLVSFLIGFTWAITGCYNCNSDENGCNDPIKYELSTVDSCAEVRPNESRPQGRVLKEQLARAGREEVTYICAQIQIRSTFPNRTGIHRTCLVKTPSNDGCDILNTEFKEQGYGEAIRCITCDDYYCNHLTEETIENSGRMTFSLLSTFVSILFVTCVF